MPHQRMSTSYRQHTAAAAVWICGLLVVAASRGSCPSTKLRALPERCQQLSRVCVDQSVYVMYESRSNPRHALFQGLPTLQLKNLSANYHGFGDMWGTGFQHPAPMFRPATSGEESEDLSHPQFSRCTVPLIIYAHHLYDYGDFFINTAAPLYMMQVNQTLDNRLTLVVDTLGMKLQPFHRFLLSPFSAFRVTTLSHLSSRLPLHSREVHNPSAHHVRCFRRLIICQMQGAGGTAAAELAQSAPMHHPLWSTGQAIFSHYKARLPAIDPSFADKSKLKVLISALSRSDNVRAMINQEQVWSWCQKFKPPAGVQDWNGTACLLHEFGKDLLSDLLYTSQADVLLGLHGDSLHWAFFMTKYSSVVEIRPRGWDGPQANQHMKEVTAADGGSILWWGIDIVDPAHSAPGLLETQHRGLPQYWPLDRHVFMRLMACQHIFERIALARGNPDAYAKFVQRKEHHITDKLQAANEAGYQSTRDADDTAGRADNAAAAAASGQPMAAAAASPSPQEPAQRLAPT